MNILALDLATRYGWAVGDIADGPAWGHHELSGGGRNFGPRLCAYETWLVRMIDAHCPDEIVYEKPIHVMHGKSRLESRVFLINLGGITEKVCTQEEVPCFWINPSTAKKHFTGSGRADKDAMVTAAWQRGWRVDVHDEADALALWTTRAWQLDPDLGARFDPISAGAA